MVFHSETEIDKAYGLIKRLVFNSTSIPQNLKMDTVHDLVLKFAQERKMINYSYVYKGVEDHIKDFKKSMRPNKKWSIKHLAPSFFVELEKVSNVEDTTQIHDLAECDLEGIRSLLSEEMLEEMLILYSDDVSTIAIEQGITTQAVYQRRDRLILYARRKLKINRKGEIIK